jgi:hypothetical protein
MPVVLTTLLIVLHLLCCVVDKVTLQDVCSGRCTALCAFIQVSSMPTVTHIIDVSLGYMQPMPHLPA